MTTEPETLTGTPIVNPEPDSRLDSLTAEYARIKPLADKYAAELKGLIDAIKSELTTQHPDHTKLLLTSSYLLKPLELCAVTSWQLDTKKLKKDSPEMWVRYAQQRTTWRLAPLRG